MTASHIRGTNSGWKEQRNHPESRLSVWLSYAVLLAGAGAGVASAFIVISTYSPLPHWDEWALFDHLASGKAWSLPWLWTQHNEHRILISKVFFLVDVEFFRGRQVFLLASIFLIQLLQVGLLSWSLRVLGALRSSAWRIGTGLIAYCVLCPTQYENLIWGFQLQFVVPAAMATLCFLAPLLYDRERNEGKPRVSLLAICIAAATVATWSLANGMLLWPLLILAALLLRMVPSTWMALLAASAVNIGLYFYHYHRPSPQSGVLPLQSIGQRLQYVAVYFGSTFIRHSGGAIALIAGAIGICAALVIVVRVVRQREKASLLQLELSLIMLFCLATAGMTSSGRLQLGLEQASASRYQTFALLFWCCLGLVLLIHVTEDRVRFESLALVLPIMMLGFASQVRLPLIDAEWHQLRLKIVSMALLTGVHDPAVLADAYPDPQAVLRAADYMKQNRLSIFAGPQYAQLGHLLNAEYQLRPASECSGYVSSSQVLPTDDGNGLRLTGYAWDSKLQRPARDIIATVDGRVSGFGSNVAIPLTSASAGPQADPSRFGWVAFVRETNPASRIQLYALVGQNGLAACPFAETSP